MDPTQRRRRPKAANGTVAGVQNPRARQRALAIGVGHRPTPGSDAELAELKELLRTAGVATVGDMVQRRPEPDPDRYFGRGKLVEVAAEIKRCDANLVACDDELAPRQERNLEEELGVPVIDRTAVILDIFADHANTAEGKLQVELAQLEYNLARMRGLWTHLERLGAGRMDGGSAPGARASPRSRPTAASPATGSPRCAAAQGRRAQPRDDARRARAGALPTVALAGYTNAGKSTLLNAITGAGVGVGDRLFHTLDPTTRSFEHDGRRYLMTDTVGFIRKLPHQLVDAFKATLEETTRADLIVHVVDGSERQVDGPGDAAVDDVLEEIGAGDTPRLLVYNKIDLLDEEGAPRLLVGEPDAIGVSAATGEGVDELLEPSGRLRGDAAADRAADSLRRRRGPERAPRHRRPRGARGARRRRAGQGASSAGRRAPLRELLGQRRRGLSPTSGQLVELKFRLLMPGALLPVRANDDDAGLDLHAVEPAVIGAGERAAIGTGIAVEIPPGHAGLVLPRSGLALKHGISLVNAPGLIDCRLPGRDPGPAAEHRPGARLRDRARPADRPAARRPVRGGDAGRGGRAQRHRPRRRRVRLQRSLSGSSGGAAPQAPGAPAEASFEVVAPTASAVRRMRLALVTEQRFEVSRPRARGIGRGPEWSRPEPRCHKPRCRWRCGSAGSARAGTARCA